MTRQQWWSPERRSSSPDNGVDALTKLTRLHLGSLPAHSAPSPAGPTSHVAADGARRDAEAELEEQFGRDALLAPARIAAGHRSDQPLEVRREARPPRTGSSARGSSSGRPRRTSGAAGRSPTSRRCRAGISSRASCTARSAGTTSSPARRISGRRGSGTVITGAASTLGGGTPSARTARTCPRRPSSRSCSPCWWGWSSPRLSPDSSSRPSTPSSGPRPAPPAPGFKSSRRPSRASTARLATSPEPWPRAISRPWKGL